MVNPDFRDLFAALNEAGASYLVVGAHAVAFYAEPRYTKDLDIWVDASPGNAPRILTALRAFGAPHVRTRSAGRPIRSRTAGDSTEGCRSEGVPQKRPPISGQRHGHPSAGGPSSRWRKSARCRRRRCTI